ncbi:GPI ethanolamine phosphate transferase 2 [Golovinomyces cichoracearum]|uniref:GPI ethanolamine phosphate transferase 2 n=1 Tax=Golovinomyces cichoracearum TaxID=62708 RepID=A0A420HGB9_9PEZI|nr:GPI ethanolamine phosphate transferase 2 [Golovinomyces cichoracearum]
MPISSSLIFKIYFSAANFFILVSLFVFSGGFFPYKPFLSGLSKYEYFHHDQFGSPPAAPFEKIIFMVVDALRSDFVYGNNSGFDFTQSLIASGAAVPFTAHARSPTITMPRIKALSTGSIPSFLDAILNFAESDTTSSLVSQDSWLLQMKAKGTGKMIMFGDDTWLKLFPGIFDRVDGTNSFFVSDFLEVDTNVSRHIPHELENPDWNTMVLHYLGLDHIGHKAGPRSPHMIFKQIEMDAIVEQIYQAILSKEHLESTVLVLLGDHGMNEAGNHGGSSPGESSPALVFISPKFKNFSSRLEVPSPHKEDFRYYSHVEQSDIAPTLGILLGFPIPRNNLGIIIPQFMPFWPTGNDKIQIYLENVEQILHLVRVTYPSYFNDGPPRECGSLTNLIDKLICECAVLVQSVPENSNDEKNVQLWLEAVITWLKQAQSIMSNVASNYDMSLLGFGLTLSLLALVLSIAAASDAILKGFKSCAPLLTVIILHGIMMFGSSYIEEEHQFWYWVTSAWLGILCIKFSRKDGRGKYVILLILLAVRIAVRWNQTGQKFAGQPDIVKNFLFKHLTTLWLLVIIAYMWSLQRICAKMHPRFPSVASIPITSVLLLAALSFKIKSTNEDSPELVTFLRPIANMSFGFSLVSRARFLYLLLAILFWGNILARYIYNDTSRQITPIIHNLLVLLLFTQARIENIPLLLIFEIMFVILSHIDLNIIEITTTCLLLQHMSFYTLGGSNAISSIDLSNAYNGINNFNVYAVGILTFISNWTGPIFWTSAANTMLIRLHRRGQKNVFTRHVALLTLFLSNSLFFIMAACIALRSHLFIWTVFSPRFLYSLAWSLGQHTCVNLGFGYFLFRVEKNT